MIRLKYLTFSILFFLTASTQLFSQFYFFGRNKVQYEDFNWKIIKTDHFDIYYYDDFEEIAEIGAAYAEASYKDLKEKFNHIVVRRIPLIFYNTHIHFQQTNTLPGFIPEGVGGFFEFIKGRVVIPYLGSLDKFRHVINHELVHVYMTSMLLGQMKNHRIPADRFPPLWFVEGLAEFWSTAWDSQAEMIMRDAVLNDIFQPLRTLDKINGTFLMYKEGQAFLEFVAERYGEDKILKILNNFWRFTKFKDNLEFSINKKFEDIDNEWEFYVKQKYFPLYANRVPHSATSNKLTNKGFNFSPEYYKNGDDEYLVYIGNHNGYTSVFRTKLNLSDIDEQKTEVLIRGEKEDVFETFHLLVPSLTLSRDRKLAFITKSKESDVIHLYSLDENEIIETIRFDNLISITSPSYSYKSEKLVFSATDAQGFNDIYEYELSTKTINRITNDYYEDADPVYNKDSDKIYFVSDRTEGKYEGRKNLFMHDLATHKTKYVTYMDADISNPDFNLDYTQLFFTSNYDGIDNIYKLNNYKTPESAIRVTDFVNSVFEFNLIDSTRLVYSGFEKFSFQFYITELENILETDTIKFDYSNIGLPWNPAKIMLKSESEQLKYEKEYSLDYAISQVITDPVYGTRGGAIMTISDLMGNDRYLFMMYNTAEVTSDVLKSFNLALTRVNYSKRTNFGYGIFNFSGRRYDLRESDEFFYERSFGTSFSFLYPFSSFNRLEANLTVANTNKEVPEDMFISSKALLVSNTISFVHDNSLWGPTGPLDGSRFRLLVGYTSDLKYSNTNYYSLIADYRKYLRLSLKSSLAIRTSLYYNDGKDARRYLAGGSWDLRGWRRWSVRGEKLWVSSVEFRFPLIDQFYIKFPLFGLGFTSIRGAAFFDAGGAWDNDYKETLGSIGGGIRFNFLNAIVFRYDVGKKIENKFSTLQKGLFYQFFFGVDF